MKASPTQKLLLILYSALMLWLLFFQRIGVPSPLPYREAIRQNCNIVPFRSIVSMLRLIPNRPSLRLFALRNLLGNILLFIPLGYLLPAVFRSLSVFWRFFLFFTGSILTVEIIQLLTLLGSFDIDDLILNLAGGLMGYALWRMAHFQGKHRTRE